MVYKFLVVLAWATLAVGQERQPEPQKQFDVTRLSFADLQRVTVLERGYLTVPATLGEAPYVMPASTKAAWLAAICNKMSPEVAEKAAKRLSFAELTYNGSLPRIKGLTEEGCGNSTYDVATVVRNRKNGGGGCKAFAAAFFAAKVAADREESARVAREEAARKEAEAVEKAKLLEAIGEMAKGL